MFYYEKRIVMFLECKQKFLRRLDIFKKNKPYFYYWKIEETIDSEWYFKTRKIDSYRARISKGW